MPQVQDRLLDLLTCYHCATAAPCIKIIIKAYSNGLHREMQHALPVYHVKNVLCQNVTYAAPLSLSHRPFVFCFCCFVVADAAVVREYYGRQGMQLTDDTPFAK